MKNENLFVEQDEGCRTVLLQQFINSKILVTVNNKYRRGNMIELLMTSMLVWMGASCDTENGSLCIFRTHLGDVYTDFTYTCQNLSFW